MPECTVPSVPGSALLVAARRWQHDRRSRSGAWRPAGRRAPGCASAVAQPRPGPAGRRTRPAPAPSSRASSSWHDPSAPSATTLTRPSARFSAMPVRPSSSAFDSGPPAEAHALDAAAHPGGQPHRLPGASPAAVPRPRLAVRAGVGRAVHERVAADQGTAARARLPRAAVDVQRPVEVAALPVDVDVQAVEGLVPPASSASANTSRTASISPADLGRAQPVSGPGEVQLGPPQRLVGVDVADAADQRLIQQRPLDPGPARCAAGP